jgi:hypothetical protein
MMTRWIMLTAAALLMGACLARGEDERIKQVPAAELKLIAASSDNGAEMIDVAPKAILAPGNVGSLEAPRQMEAAPIPEAAPDGGVSRPRLGCVCRIWQWLTYRPLSRPGCCGCHKACNPCGLPHLYIFFLCDQNGKSGCRTCGKGDVAYGGVIADTTAEMSAD